MVIENAMVLQPQGYLEYVKAQATVHVVSVSLESARALQLWHFMSIRPALIHVPVGAEHCGRPVSTESTREPPHACSALRSRACKI